MTTPSSTTPAPRRKKFWGWGYEDVSLDPKAIAFVESSLALLFGGSPVRRAPPHARDLRLPEPRIAPFAGLETLFRQSPEERARHALGRSYRDVARAVQARFEHAPDLVALPENEADVVRLLDAAQSHNVAVIPFGGGTSVSGGIEPLVGPRFAGTMSLDLSRLRGVAEIDETCLAARILAGTAGPDLEDALRPYDLSLRFFPQSFELATLGGWIVTRAGGHFATGPTHIDDLVESVRMITPRGLLETRRLPASGAGPQPERMVLGSEGILGVVTEAWVRVVRRPRYRRAKTVRFVDLPRAVNALRQLLQAGLTPSNARVLDPAEVLLSGSGPAEAALLLLAFESADLSVDGLMDQAIELARQAGGTPNESEKAERTERDETADQYKSSFIRAPYLRDELILRETFVETYETAVLYSRFEELYGRVVAAVDALDLGPHLLSCRVTHAYRDGCAPYFTLVARPKSDDPGGLCLWLRAKETITQAFLDSGATSTHHHAVGRDLARMHQSERPELFSAMLSAAKEAVDPGGIMNPGVILPARSA